MGGNNESSVAKRRVNMKEKQQNKDNKSGSDQYTLGDSINSTNLLHLIEFRELFFTLWQN